MDHSNGSAVDLDHSDGFGAQLRVSLDRPSQLRQSPRVLSSSNTLLGALLIACARIDALQGAASRIIIRGRDSRPRYQNFHHGRVAARRSAQAAAAAPPVDVVRATTWIASQSAELASHSLGVNPSAFQSASTSFM